MEIQLEIMVEVYLLILDCKHAQKLVKFDMEEQRCLSLSLFIIFAKSVVHFAFDLDIIDRNEHLFDFIMTTHFLLHFFSFK